VQAALLPAPSEVLAVRQESEDTFTLTLRRPPGAAPLPGQFNMLYAFGVGEVPISFSGIGEEELVHTIRAVGAVTRALCAARPGDVLGVRGPYGAAWPMARAQGRDLLIVAGGIGLAPLRPAIEQALAERSSYGRLLVVVGTRTPGDRLFLEDLDEWRARDDVELWETVDAAGDDWTGDVGVVTTLLPQLRLDPARTLGLLCGPEIMMRFTANRLLRAGVDPEEVFVSMERNMKCAVGTCGHCQLAGRELRVQGRPRLRLPRGLPPDAGA
jgi:NAD(P)H-flavin reductase